MQGWLRMVACWSPPGPSAIDRRARPSGTRIQTGLLKSPSIKGAPTANLVSRLAFRSRLSPVNDAGDLLEKMPRLLPGGMSDFPETRDPTSRLAGSIG